MSLRPTFMGFETMRKAISASQKALDITGSNIANVNTLGYSRQRLDLFAVNTPGGNLRYRTAVGLSGQGVGMYGVAQLRDPFLDKSYRNLSADASSSGTEFAILSDIENILDQFTTDGFTTSFVALQAALKGYEANNTDRGEIANITLQNANHMIQAIRSYNTKLAQVKDDTNKEMQAGVKRVAAIFKQLGALNEEIVNGYVSSGDIIKDGDGYQANTKYGPNELKDQRNLLLDELSSYGNIRTHDNPNGSIRVEFAGQEVVNDKIFKSIEMIEHSTGAVSYNIVGTGGTRTPITPTSESLTGGALRGYLDIYNGAGVYSNDPAIRAAGVEAEVKEIRTLLTAVADAFKAQPPIDITRPQPGKGISILTELQQHGKFELDGAGNLTLEGEQMVSADGKTVQTIDVVSSINNANLEIRLGGKTLNNKGVAYDVSEINRLINNVVNGAQAATDIKNGMGTYKGHLDNYEANMTTYEAHMAIYTPQKAEYDKQMKIFNDPDASAADKATAKAAADAAKAIMDPAKVEADDANMKAVAAKKDATTLINALKVQYAPDLMTDPKTGNISYNGKKIYDSETGVIDTSSIVPPTVADILPALQKIGAFTASVPGPPPSGDIMLDGKVILSADLTTTHLKFTSDDAMNVSIDTDPPVAGVPPQVVDIGAGSIADKRLEGELLSITSGSLATVLNESNQNYYVGTNNGLVYYQSAIDALANTIARSFNDAASDPSFVNPDTGEFYIRAMFSPSDKGEKITAGNIAVTQEWLDDPAMIAKHIEWVDEMDHTKGIKSAVTPLEELDTTYIQKLSHVADGKLSFSIDTGLIDDKAVDFECTISSYIMNVSNRLGGDIKFVGGLFSASNSSLETASNGRDTVMGVDINEEGTNMMNFQKWFNASSRMLTTLDEALDTIISKMGLVGR